MFCLYFPYEKFTGYQLTTPKLIRSYFKFEIDYPSEKISFRSTKLKKMAHFAFIVAYFSIHWCVA